MVKGSGADRADVHQFFSRRSLADVLRNRHADAAGQTEEGFTLIEMMIALFVFALLASGFAVTMGSSLRVFSRSRVKTVGEQIANDKLEGARRMPYFSLGNTTGNPHGDVPLTQTQTVGGYTFTVLTEISYVDDPVAISIRTFADYKRVVVTVTAVGLGAPPVIMTTLVAPPAKPAADRGQLQVTVSDAVTNLNIQTGVGVDIKNGAILSQITSNVGGVATFADLPPSPILGPTPAPGVNDWYYVNGGTGAFALPTGWYVSPASDSSRALNTNKFTLPPAFSTQKNLKIYKAANSSMTVTDNDGNTLLDPFSVTLTLTTFTGYAPRVINLPANTLVVNFSEAPIAVGLNPALGIIPDGTYTYSVNAGPGCVSTDQTVTLAKNPLYPTDTSVTWPVLKAPCSFSFVTVHLFDGFTSLPLVSTNVTVTGPLGTNQTVQTNAAGDAVIRLRADATPYNVQVPAQSGHAEVNFPLAVSGVTTPQKNISVPPLSRLITGTLKDDFTLLPIANATVSISGGPAGILPIANVVTDVNGLYSFTVPYGSSYPSYVVTAPAAGGRKIVSSAPLPSNANVVVPDMFQQWTTMMTVNVTLTGANANTGPLANMDFVLTGGPAGANVTYNSGPTGTIPISVPWAAGANYVIAVAADGAGRQATSINFPPTGAGPVNKTVSVTWTTVTLTIRLQRASNGLNLNSTNVLVTGGPANYSKTSPTAGSGPSTVTFTVPIGTTAYTITVPSSSGTPAVLQVVLGPGNLTVVPNITVAGT